MQKLFLLLTVIISRAVPSPIAQLDPDGSFDIAFSAFDDSRIAAPDAPEPFQLAQSETQPEAPVEAPPNVPNVPQPGDPAFKPVPRPEPGVTNLQQPPRPFKQPFNCEGGKSGACCIGGTHDGVTSGCVSYTPWDDWCQNHDTFKCCTAQPDKDAAIAAGTLVDDHFRENCDDPKGVESSTQQKFQNFGNSLLRMIVPQIDPGLSFPKPVFIPSQ